MARANLLPVSEIVNVTVTLAPQAAAYRNFGAALILGDSDVVDIDERIRSYGDMTGVAQDYSVDDPEYKAALLHYSQNPKPNILYIGRWASADVKAVLLGRPLTTVERTIATFQAVTSGALFCYLNGVPKTVTFSTWAGVSNLNNVASIMQTAFDSLDTGATVVWNDIYHRFEVRTGSDGATASLSVAKAPTASGYASFSGQPTPTTDQITINGSLVNFVANGGSPGNNEVEKGTDLEGTLRNLETMVNQSTDVNIEKVTAIVEPGATPDRIYFVSKLTGAPGNAYTLAKSGSVISVSGANLTGGTGTDVSGMTGLTVGGGTRVADGVNAETLQEAIVACIDVSGDWYGLTVAASGQITDNDYIAAAQTIEAESTTRIFGITTMDEGTLDPVITSDLASKLQDLDLMRTFIQYSSDSPYAATSLFARASTVDFNANRSVITIKFKQEPSVAAEQITKTQADTLKAKNCNVFVEFQNFTSIIKEGVMCNGYFFDEVQGTDWLQNRLQEDVWNLFLTNTTKIPQTDEGMNMIVTVLNASMVAAVNNGLVAPGRWNGPPIGQLKYGDIMNIGFYVYAPLMNTQSQADREARKAPPIQIAAKLAGAIHFANILVTCNR